MTKFLKKFNFFGFKVSDLRSLDFLVVFTIILVQLVLTGIIFFEVRELKKIDANLNYNTTMIRADWEEMQKKLDYLQSVMMRISSQLYRTSADDN